MSSKCQTFLLKVNFLKLPGKQRESEQNDFLFVRYKAGKSTSRLFSSRADSHSLASVEFVDVYAFGNILGLGGFQKKNYKSRLE